MRGKFNIELPINDSSYQLELIGFLVLNYLIMSYKVGAQEMRNLAELVDTRLKEKTKEKIGFVVFTFDFKGGNLNYISNGNREDMSKLLEELLDKWKNENPLQTFEEN